VTERYPQYAFNGGETDRRPKAFLVSHSAAFPDLLIGYKYCLQPLGTTNMYTVM